MATTSPDEVDPRFSRRAAQVLNSGYWTADRPKGGSDADYLRWANERWAERELVEEAVHQARRYEDLTGRVKDLFDAAEAFNKAHS